LLGTKVAGVEGYQVVIGGGSDQDQGLARELVPAIEYSRLSPMMERLFEVFTERRRSRESFLQFSRRHSIDELRAFVALKEAVTR